MKGQGYAARLTEAVLIWLQKAGYPTSLWADVAKGNIKAARMFENLCLNSERFAVVKKEYWPRLHWLTEENRGHIACSYFYPASKIASFVENGFAEITDCESKKV